jgi:hypothetical protein
MIYKSLHRKLSQRRTDTSMTKRKRRWTHVFLNGKIFMLHYWHPSCYFCCKPVGKSWMRKRPDCSYYQRNICDTDSRNGKLSCDTESRKGKPPCDTASRNGKLPCDTDSRNGKLSCDTDSRNGKLSKWWLQPIH